MKMRRRSATIAALFPMLATVTCQTPRDEDVTGTPSESLYSPVTGPITARCNPRNDIGGYIRIVLPKRLAFREASGSDPATPVRKVFSRKFGAVEPVNDGPDDEEKKVPTSPADPQEEDNTPEASENLKEPFHIYLQNAKLNPSGKRYISVKIVIPRESDYAFYPEIEADPDVDNDFFAVGYGIGKSTLLAGHLCFNGTNVTKIPSTGTDRPRRVFRFYIDTRNLNKNESYLGSINILLQPYTSPETMIIVDPRIRNDG